MEADGWKTMGWALDLSPLSKQVQGSWLPAVPLFAVVAPHDAAASFPEQLNCSWLKTSCVSNATHLLPVKRCNYG